MHLIFILYIEYSSTRISSSWNFIILFFKIVLIYLQNNRNDFEKLIFQRLIKSSNYFI